MPLSAQVEPYAAAIDEMVPLYVSHWHEIALDQERREAQLAPRFQQYDARDAAGEIVLVTLRDAGRLCGYFLCFVGYGLHYGLCMTAQMDVLYVHPSVRGRFGGLRLIRTMIGPGGVAWPMAGAILRYLNPWFHPWKQDNRAAMNAWLDANGARLRLVQG